MNYSTEIRILKAKIEAAENIQRLEQLAIDSCKEMIKAYERIQEGERLLESAMDNSEETTKQRLDNLCDLYWKDPRFTKDND